MFYKEEGARSVEVSGAGLCSVVNPDVDLARGFYCYHDAGEDTNILRKWIALIAKT
jgi:hypothetical protein